VFLPVVPLAEQDVNADTSMTNATISTSLTTDVQAVRFSTSLQNSGQGPLLLVANTARLSRAFPKESGLYHDHADLLAQLASIKQAKVKLTGRPAQDCMSPSEPTAASNGLKLHFPTFKDRNLDDGQVENPTSSVPNLLIRKVFLAPFGPRVFPQTGSSRLQASIEEDTFGRSSAPHKQADFTAPFSHFYSVEAG